MKDCITALDGFNMVPSLSQDLFFSTNKVVTLFVLLEFTENLNFLLSIKFPDNFALKIEFSFIIKSPLKFFNFSSLRFVIYY